MRPRTAWRSADAASESRPAPPRLSAAPRRRAGKIRHDGVRVGGVKKQSERWCVAVFGPRGRPSVLASRRLDCASRRRRGMADATPSGWGPRRIGQSERASVTNRNDDGFVVTNVLVGGANGRGVRDSRSCSVALCSLGDARSPSPGVDAASARRRARGVSVEASGSERVEHSLVGDRAASAAALLAAAANSAAAPTACRSPDGFSARIGAARYRVGAPGPPRRLPGPRRRPSPRPRRPPGAHGDVAAGTCRGRPAANSTPTPRSRTTVAPPSKSENATRLVRDIGRIDLRLPGGSRRSPSKRRRRRRRAPRARRPGRAHGRRPRRRRCAPRACAVASFAIASGARASGTRRTTPARAYRRDEPSEVTARPAGTANARSSVNRSPSVPRGTPGVVARAECAAPYAPRYPDPSLSGVSRAPGDLPPRRSWARARRRRRIGARRLLAVFAPIGTSRDARRHACPRQRLEPRRRRRGWCGMSKIRSVARWNVFIFPSSRSEPTPLAPARHASASAPRGPRGDLEPGGGGVRHQEQSRRGETRVRAVRAHEHRGNRGAPQGGEPGHGPGEHGRTRVSRVSRPLVFSSR